MIAVTGLETLPALIDIAQKAIAVENLDRNAREANRVLLEAYVDFRESLGIEYVERGSREWDGMMAATKAEYAAMKDAKRLAANAKIRLQTAIRRHNRGGQ